MSAEEQTPRKVAGMFAFSHDANPEVIWECFGFDEPWNGWAAPIVDAETLVDVLEDANRWYHVEGGVFYTAAGAEPGDEEEVVVLEPDNQAHYHLRDLGWTFMESKAYETKVFQFRAKKQG